MGSVRKQFQDLLGRPVLRWSLDPFLEHDAVRSIVVALPSEDAAAPPSWLEALAPRVKVVAGGATRTESVAHALKGLPDEVSVVVVHDGARPLVRPEWIEACVLAVDSGCGAVVGFPAVDTIKRADATGLVQGTEDRASLWQVQTPQAFPRALLEEAHRRAGADGVSGTDDAQLVERVGGRVRLIRGSPENIKITFPADLLYAEAVLRLRREGAHAQEAES